MHVRHALLLPLLLLAGCGGGDDERAATSRAVPIPAPSPGPGPGPGAIPQELLPPRGVPQAPTGTAVDRGDAEVITTWARRLARGNERGAASLFALPMKFQNATPVLTIDTPRERLAIQVSLSCGARVTKLEGAGRYVIASYVLKGRPGGQRSCSGSAKSAIRVAAGRIVEWYRVVDEQVAPGDLGDTV